MPARRVIRIFGAELNPKSSKEVHYQFEPDQQRVLGLLCSSNVYVSLSFNNSTFLKYHKLFNTDYACIPTEAKIVKMNKLVKGEVLRGSVENMMTVKQNTNVYLLIEEKL